jgi:hypothetical protein
MNMPRRSHFAVILVSAALMISACGGAPTPNVNTANKTNVPAVNSPASNPDSPVATNKKAEAATSNAAPTIGPVVKAYYEALRNKDDAALLTVLSADSLKKVQAAMRAEHKTGMAAFLAETDLADSPIEVRNEKIEGDKAMAEIKGGAYLKWTPFLFVNVGGTWKFTRSSPDVQAVTSEKPK